MRDTDVGRLTRSEVRRLNVACQLLLDMAVLILDQPTKEMDIFDTFFLVEYLRNWASGGRVVIMSLHPPTYEIFAMLTKVNEILNNLNYPFIQIAVSFRLRKKRLALRFAYQNICFIQMCYLHRSKCFAQF